MLKIKPQWFLLSVIIGLLYYFLITVTVSPKKNLNFLISSKISQEAKFQLLTEYKKAKLSCNGNPVLLDNRKKHDYFYHGEEEIIIPLHRGENHCQAEHIAPKIKQKIGFLDFSLLFILLGIPLFTLVYLLFIHGLSWIKLHFSSFSSLASSREEEQKNLPLKLIGMVLLLGLIIRVAYFEKFGIMLFQHDWQGHVEMIKYVAEHWSSPAIPMKGWEYPQQPLYYLIAGGIYALLSMMGFVEQEALLGVGYFSLFCSFLFLFYGYRLLVLLSTSRWVQLVGVIFMALTPSLVYLSARINNDVLVLALSSMTLFYMVKAYQRAFKKGFYTVLILVTLLFLTKVSTAGIELLFFALLVVRYLKTTQEEEPLARSQLYWYGIVGVFVLSMTLLRLYMPLDESFYMVNSAKFPKQTIESLDWNYFFSFHLFDLIGVGQSYVFGSDSIRYSFLTYQYGTMFFGEFDYLYFIDKSPLLLYVMKLILLLGLIYPLSFISYLYLLKKEPLLHQLLFLVIVINFVLILKFIFGYPSICNTDFRYFVGSFSVLALVLGKGMKHLACYSIHTKKIVTVMVGILALGELLFFLVLILS